MIRNWLNSIRKSPVKKDRSSFVAQSELLQMERLEDRLLLAFVAFVDGDTLTLTQTFDDGDIVVDNNGTSSEFRVIDGIGTANYVGATNVVVNLLDDTGNQLDLGLDNAHTGDVTLNVGNGARAVNFIGTGNAIGGDLVVNAGTGIQIVELAVNNAIDVTGSASFSLGTDFDVVDEDAENITVGADWNMTDVNRFENNGTMSVGGNVVFDTSADDSTGEFDNDATMNITGDFSYTGNNMTDTLNTNADFNLTGNYVANTAEGTTNFNINNPNVNIDGDVMLTSTDSANVDDLNTAVGATFGGDWTVDLGDGINNADFFGTFNGSNVGYTGGSGVDTVNYDFSGNPADVIVTLGDGDDDFTLGPNASIAPTTLSVDFGDNSDTFTNNFGAFTFDAMLLGLLGFDYAYDSTTDTLSATEVSNAGAVEFDNNGLGNAFRFNNGGADLVPAANFNVTMLDGTGATLDIDLDFAHTGNMSIDIGDGIRTLNFSGFNNSIGGDLTVIGGTDSQTVEVGVNANFAVGGNASFDLGLGVDTVDEDGSDVSITGDLDFLGVNLFENNGIMVVGGNLSFDTTNESEDSELDNDGSLTVTGNLTYIGGDEVDDVFINDGTMIGGDLFADLGDGITAGADDQDVNLTLGSSVGGTFTVISGDSTNGDSVEMDGVTSIGGDINVDLGDGSNTASFLGTFGGTDISYFGGADTDLVVFGMTGANANVNVNLFSGDDSFSLNAGAVIGPKLRVDFGGGTDTFTNNFGAFIFDASLLNWEGFDRFYNFGTDNLNIVQVLDTGDITLDDNGTANAIRLTSSALTEMTPATNVRLKLLANSSTNIATALDAGLSGNLIYDLMSGDRAIEFTGTSNTVGGLFRIEASDGIQVVDLAVNADLNVGGNAVINLREGSDSIDDGANNLNVTGNMILRSVNVFENTNDLTVGGNFNMNSTFESEDSKLDNDGTMNIGGAFTYTGGDGVDDVILNLGGVSVAGNVLIDVGNASELTDAQDVSLAGGFSAARLTIRGGDSLGGNNVTTDALTVVTGNVLVNFTDSTTNNTTVLFGEFGGGFGTYRGGSGIDEVSIDATAVDMNFVTRLGEGDDSFTLGANTVLLAGTLDGGDGVDTFVDLIGVPYPFPFTIENIP